MMLRGAHLKHLILMSTIVFPLFQPIFHLLIVVMVVTIKFRFSEKFHSGLQSGRIVFYRLTQKAPLSAQPP